MLIAVEVTLITQSSNSSGFFRNLHPQNLKELWKVIRALSLQESSFPSMHCKSGNIILTMSLLLEIQVSRQTHYQLAVVH